MTGGGQSAAPAPVLGQFLTFYVTKLIYFIIIFNNFKKHFSNAPSSATAWVLVPGGNGAAFVSTTIESIHRQEVPVRALYSNVLRKSETTLKSR